MEMEWVILGQIVAFLVVSSGTIFAVSAPKFDEEIKQRRYRQTYVDRMGR